MENLNLNLTQVEEAIKTFQDKLNLQGRVKNERDIFHLNNLKELYRTLELDDI